MSHNLSTIFDQIADDLAERGFSVIDNFLSSDEAGVILHSDEFKHGMLHFKKAGIGKVDKQINEAIRGDYIQWIDPATATPGEQVYLERLREMMTFLNRSLFLSLKDVEIHRTIYPVGTRYLRHRDQFRSDDHRKLSLICYLNTNWKPEEGGQLKMYLPKGSKDVFPQSGKLVCFRSDQIEHNCVYRESSKWEWRSKSRLYE